MPLISVNVAPKLLERLVAVLERIATVAERQFPARKIQKLDKPIGLEAMTRFDPEKAWILEVERQQQSIPSRSADVDDQ